jgi:hypothetical protein
MPSCGADDHDGGGRWPAHVTDSSSSTTIPTTSIDSGCCCSSRPWLLGAVSAFLLIATAFDFVFLTVDAYQTTPFFGSEEPTTSFIYYSLVTITTLGYGDLAAATDVGRLASTAEAVVGQVYLVTVVAMIVGLLAQARQAVRP